MNAHSPKFTSIYSSEDTAVEHEGGAPYDGSGLYEQFHSPASQLTSGQPYLTPISTAAATQVNVSIDSSRNECEYDYPRLPCSLPMDSLNYPVTSCRLTCILVVPFPQVNAEHTESQGTHF